MRAWFAYGSLIGVLLLLSACAELPRDFEPPQVTVQGLRAVASGGVVPDFEFDLRVINPNKTPLRVHGLYYTLNLEGERILSGAENHIPEIPAYGEDHIHLRAGVDVLSGIRLVTNLVQQPRAEFDYDLAVKLDIDGLRRSLWIERGGLISLNR